MVNVNARLSEARQFRCIKGLSVMRENDGMDLQADLTSQKAAGLDGVRFHITMCDQHLFAQLPGAGEQVLELPNLVAAINQRARTVILDPEMATVVETSLPHRGGKLAQWNPRESVQRRDNAIDTT
jgi:hypothetical protein